MCRPGDHEPVVSAAELDELAKLFAEYEGAPVPFSIECKEAKRRFNSLTQDIYVQRVQAKCMTVTLEQFRGYVRNECRKRIADVTPYPCILPEVTLAPKSESERLD